MRTKVYIVRCPECKLIIKRALSINEIPTIITCSDCDIEVNIINHEVIEIRSYPNSNRFYPHINYRVCDNCDMSYKFLEIHTEDRNCYSCFYGLY